MNPPERPVDMPDTSETYERGHPEKVPGEQLEAVDRKPDERPDSVQGSIRNDDDQPALAGQDPQNSADAVDPTDPIAHAGRVDAAVVPGADRAGLAAEQSPRGKESA